jgi:hypothetical protein
LVFVLITTSFAGNVKRAGIKMDVYITTKVKNIILR